MTDENTRAILKEARLERERLQAQIDNLTNAVIALGQAHNRELAQLMMDMKRTQVLGRDHFKTEFTLTGLEIVE